MVHSLSLANMQLPGVSLVSGCRQLVTAHLEGNLLVELGPLQAAASSLVELHLTDNLLSDVRSLQTLHKL
jgi:Leucine-rich repeat (LRR) protein